MKGLERLLGAKLEVIIYQKFLTTLVWKRKKPILFGVKTKIVCFFTVDWQFKAPIYKYNFTFNTFLAVIKCSEINYGV